ncbi:MAG: hypothetical protein ACE5I5_10750 [Candidatus Heimdallarchaeota archaeon]
MKRVIGEEYGIEVREGSGESSRGLICMSIDFGKSEFDSVFGRLDK